MVGTRQVGVPTYCSSLSLASVFSVSNQLTKSRRFSGLSSSSIIFHRTRIDPSVVAVGFQALPGDINFSCSAISAKIKPDLTRSSATGLFLLRCSSSVTPSAARVLLPSLARYITFWRSCCSTASSSCSVSAAGTSKVVLLAIFSSSWLSQA